MVDESPGTLKIASVSTPHFSRDDAEAGLLRHFGLPSFRPGQAEVVDSVLEGRNTVVVMPTGAGKSLCYQLPAVLMPGVSVVVSPLIALMKDQVEGLQARGISATFINSTLSESERSERIQKLRGGQYKLVYVAPERFRSPSFVEALRSAQLELFAIDEAHCISQWGHDFRPDYALLGQVRKLLRPPRTLALTASATPEVREDLIRSLLMKEPRVFVAGFDRQNLSLEVAQVKGDYERRQACLQLAREGGSGIVYCSTRKAAEGLHRHLCGEGVTSVLYHAGLDDSERHKAQDAFMGSPTAVAVATNAFGMGIDKPDIRFVAHAHIPRAVEAYYQEIGRAGRDGAPAKAVLLFNHADVFTQERLIQGNHPPEAVIADVWRVLVGPGHGEIAEFDRGIAALSGQCGASEFEVSAALKILEREGKIIRGGTARASRVKTIRALERLPFRELNLNLERVRERERRSLQLLKQMTAYAYTKSCRRAFILDYFGESHPPVSCGSCDVCSGATLTLAPSISRAADARPPQRRTRAGLGRSGSARSGSDRSNGSSAVAKSAVPDAEAEIALIELKRWRKELAKDLQIPAFIIFNDATLNALARALPIDRETFLSVKGAGESRWERFGSKVVEVSRAVREGAALAERGLSGPTPEAR